MSRTEHEGISFLAISLANFGKATQKWLDQGFVVPSDVPEFKRAPGRRTGLPAFMQGFLGRVFDPCSGALLSDPDIEAIFAIRQLTLMFSKIAFSGDPLSGTSLRQSNPNQVVSEEREKLAMSAYVQCEQEVRNSDASLHPRFMEDFKRVSKVLFGEMFAGMESSISMHSLIPKHGPGAVAEKLSSNAKWNQQTWPLRMQQVFPADRYIVPNISYMDYSGQKMLYSPSAAVHLRRVGSQTSVSFLEPGAEIPVRVIAVPKTLKTPRIIAIEPTAMQYAQQAVFRLIRDHLSRDDSLRMMIGLDDQDPNRVLAHLGSLSGELATLDMSEASDRVSNQHVLALFDGFPLLSEAIQSCRSRKADVPGHGVIRLAKFASMGSALCFPIEAMVFLTIIFIGIERELSAPLSCEVVAKHYRKQVRVFGDDIIVPVDNVLSVVSELTAFGQKVNASKSYWTGKFRESCGREYYDGNDVSIVKIRQLLPTRRQSAAGGSIVGFANEVISAVSTRNQLYWAGLWKSAGWLDNYLGKLLKEFPNVAPTSPVLGRESALGYQFQKLDPYTHSPLVKGFYVHAEPPPDPLEGSGALLKCLLRLRNWDAFDVASVDDEHLERSGRPEHVNIKLGWRSPF